MLRPHDARAAAKEKVAHEIDFFGGGRRAN
jgi:hypothetical protein